MLKAVLQEEILLGISVFKFSTRLKDKCMKTITNLWVGHTVHKDVICYIIADRETETCTVTEFSMLLKLLV
jgi:hypothetical protein